MFFWFLCFVSKIENPAFLGEGKITFPSLTFMFLAHIDVTSIFINFDFSLFNFGVFQTFRENPEIQDG